MLTKPCRHVFTSLAFVCLLCFASKSSYAAIDIDFVVIGDPGNPENVAPKFDDGSTGYGRVDYSFRMAKYEVTNEQYATFLNSVAKSDPHGLYSPGMGTKFWGGIERTGTDGNYSYTTKPHFHNKPVLSVSFQDAARFVNWMHNGQKTDPTTTEYGAYTFSGTDTLGARNTDAQFYIPNEHEWQKAGFYEEGADTLLGNGWWRRFSGQDFDVPTAAIVNSVGDVINPGPLTAVYAKEANWNGSETAGWQGAPAGNVATVGSAGSMSPYGLYDMMGNAFEWVETDPTKPDPNGWGPYMVLGGSYRNAGHYALNERNLAHHVNHNIANANTGFRVAAAIPEPSSIAMMSCLVLLAFGRRRQRCRRINR